MSQIAHLPQTDYARAVAGEVRSHAARRLINQSDIARALGKSTASVNERWHGKTPWTLNELAGLAAWFGIEPSDLLPTTTTAGRQSDGRPGDVHPLGLEPRTQWLSASAGQSLATVTDLATYRAERAARRWVLSA